MDGKFIKDSSITKAKLSLVDPVSALDPVTLQFFQNSLYAQDWKNSCRVATTANITVSSAPATIDGITLSSGDRVLVKNQSTANQNGIYVFNGSGSAMTRSTDADSSGDLTTNMAVLIEEGTTNAGTMWRLSTTGAITIGTTAISFSQFGNNSAVVPAAKVIYQAASATTGDYQHTGFTLGETPNTSNPILVGIEGVGLFEIGNAVRTKPFYFTGDNGTTARALSAIVSGDKLYYVKSATDFNADLATTDKLIILYWI